MTLLTLFCQLHFGDSILRLQLLKIKFTCYYCLFIIIVLRAMRRHEL